MHQKVVSKRYIVSLFILGVLLIFVANYVQADKKAAPSSGQNQPLPTQPSQPSGQTAPTPTPTPTKPVVPMPTPTNLPAGSVKVPILIYHSTRAYKSSDTDFVKEFVIEPPILEQELKYLADNNYTVISFDDLVNHFQKNTSLPAKPVILTFDDGWENQYTYAFPLLKKYKFTATFFIFTNAIDHRHFMTWQEIKELVAAGMTIGDHTKSHPYLFRVKDINKLRDEIIGAKKILEQNLGKEVDIFAEPYGYPNDLIISVIKEAGFKAARTAYPGIYHTKGDLLNLKAEDVSSDNTSEFMNALK